MTQHSIEAKTLPELKQLALDELELTREAVKQHGDLRSRSTWLKAIAQAFKDGLTTREYRELPIIQGTTLQDNEGDSESLQDNTPPKKQIQLSTVPWLDDPAALERIEASIDWKHHCNLLVNPSELKWLRRKEASFCCYENWMYPGKFVQLYPVGLVQILFYDLHGFVYYISLSANRVLQQYLPLFLEKAMSVPHTHQRAVEYINKLYTNLSICGIATINV